MFAAPPMSCIICFSLVNLEPVLLGWGPGICTVAMGRVDRGAGTDLRSGSDSTAFALLHPPGLHLPAHRGSCVEKSLFKS